MKALTLIQPWSWAVAHAGKRVENRTWAPPKAVIGQRIAIHAGKRCEPECKLRIFAHKHGFAPLPGIITLPGQFVQGAVESVATIAGWVQVGDPGGAGSIRAHFGLKPDAPLPIAGIGLTTPQVTSALESPWWIGPVGWVLTDVIALPEPVPCRGAQGLWTLPADVERAVLAQVGGAS